MKKLILTTVFSVILGALSFAQTVQKIYHFENPVVGEMNGYDVLRFADTYNHGVVGEASLPWQSVSLLLPQNTDAQDITVEYSDFVELEGTYNILPYQKARPLSSTEPLLFEKNEEFYKSENVYPENSFSKVKTQYLNGYSFAFAQFTPVRYVPATGKVSYATTVTVSVGVTASKSDRSSLLWMTPEVNGRVERLAQNPEALTEYKTSTRSIPGYELLVVTPQQWVPYFDEYVAFYEARGLRTHVTALEDILPEFEGRDDAEKLREYIKQEYENEGIMMVLLGGDSNLVPWRALYCNVYDEEVDNLPADMYFVCLDGDWNDDDDELWGEVGEEDLLPELGVGRMPFNNEIQFNNMMHKTLEYQTNPVLGEFRDVILGGEHLGDGYYGSNDMELLIGGSSQFGYTTVGIPENYNFIKIYADGPTGWSGGLFRQAINQNGGQYVHHVGHANTDYVAGWYVESTNDNSFAQLDGVHHNYNFFHSHGCICGDFTHNCILERLVNISTGFVATTGNSRYGWYQPWGDGMAAHLHREFVDAYYNDRLPYIGTAFVEMKVMTAPYVEWDPCMRWNVYDINILGDVAVCPWLDEPFRPEVSYQSALPQGTISTPITITKDGAAQSNFRCSLYHNGELLAFGMTNAYGYAELEFADALNVTDTMQLIITGPNAIPQTLDVIGLNDNVAFVFPENNNIHGDFIFGRNISMDVDFRNAGVVDANAVTASLTTTSNYVDLTKSTVEIGNISAGAVVAVQDAFSFVVADNIPNGTYVDFLMTCTDGTNVWCRDVFFMAKAPLLKITDATFQEIQGDNNGFVDAGETVRVDVYGNNKGLYVANNAMLHGSSDSPYITFISNDIQLGNLDAETDFENSIVITVDEDAPNGTVIYLNLVVSSGTYSAAHEVVIVVGTLKEDFETGDFSHMLWYQYGDAEWIVTDEVAHTGSYSAQAGYMPANQTTSMAIDIESLSDGFVSFYYKTDTKYKIDGLAFFIDGKCMKYWSGQHDWTYVEYPVTAGTHNLEWQFITDVYGHDDNSVCWIDDIIFPGNTLVIDDVTEVEQNIVTVYPNPANDVLYIKGVDTGNVEIYNFIGVKVVSKSVSSCESINITDLASGMYFVRIADKNGDVSTVKIVKK